MTGTTSDGERRIYHREYRLRTRETGDERRALPVALCGLLQESANLHAHDLGASLELLAEKGFTWFLARFQLEVDVYPKWREAMRVETWPAEMESLYAVRDYRFFDDSGTELGRATSQWLFIDLERRRPMRRPPAFVADLHPTHPVRALPTNPRRLPELSNASHLATTRVRRSDLDHNGHLNSIVQLELLMEALPQEVQESKRLRELVVEHKSEGQFGEALANHVEEISPGVWLHDLRAAEDDRLIARARTTWIDPSEEESS